MSFMKFAPAVLLGALLSACGGGGGSDDGVSPAPTNLSQSTTEARQAVEFSVSGAAAIVAKSSVLDNNPLFDLTVPGGSTSQAAPTLKALSASRSQAPRVKPQALISFGCADLQVFTGPCTGTVGVDASFLDSATQIPADSFLSMSFNGLSGVMDGISTRIDGVFRIDFLTAVNSNATSFANARLRITLTNFSGTEGGISYGPESFAALLEFDAQGQPTITVGDLTLSKVSNLVVTDNSNYRIGSAQLRKPYWGSEANKIDGSFQTWAVGQGRPAVGSVASLTASNGVTAKVEVSASSSSTVVYPVQIAIGASTKRYTVTASYASATAAPTYAVVELP
ncbi:MAG: hypothetical protein IV097_24620 [Burkholderiaceae bacterium]|nr:hypothetical protein [Burkholderiaceae bacterium]